MPRKPRTDAAGAIHHVIARGNARTRIVEDDEDRRAFIGSLAAVSGRLEWRVHAYCLMDTHVHAVVETPTRTLGEGMRRLLGGHAFQFNRRHNRFGHLFAGRYAASEIDSDAYLLEVCAYVVLNPVRAGLVIEPGEWKWSSYRFAAGIARVPLFCRDERRARDARERAAARAPALPPARPGDSREAKIGV